MLVILSELRVFSNLLSEEVVQAEPGHRRDKSLLPIAGKEGFLGEEQVRSS